MSQDKKKPTVWSYNGIELELDLGDADTMDLTDNAFEEMGKYEKALKKDGPSADFIRAYCKMYENLFDTIFQKQGTYARLTGGKTHNINVAHDVYEAFLDFVKEQSDSMVQRRNAVSAKYSPNRAQRRAQAKKNG